MIVCDKINFYHHVKNFGNHPHFSWVVIMSDIAAIGENAIEAIKGLKAI